MHNVTFSTDARRFFEAADRTLQRKLDRCFEVLKHTPRRHPNIKALKGRLAGLYRYRIGDYRVVYVVDDKDVTVAVVTIAHRRDVYD